MAFYTKKELTELGLKKIGENVKISKLASIHDAELIEIDDYSRIDDFCVLSGKIIIGKNVHIAVFNNIAGGTEGIVFKDFSGLAYGCHVFTQSDDYSGKSLTNPTVPAEFKIEKKSAIEIGKHVIVGTSSLIFPGVKLSEGTSVGAMAMVTKSTKAWKVYAGIPAKPITERKKDLLLLEKEYLAIRDNK